LVGGFGAGAGLRVVAPGDGVQLRVALVDCGEARVEELDGRELAAAQGGGELESR